MASKARAWHSMESGQVERELSTSFSSGLSIKNAEELLARHGPNELIERKKVSVLEIFLSQFRSLVVAALLAAAAVSFLMEEYLDVAVICAVLLLNASIGTFQEYRAEKSLEALKRMSATSSRVIRGGRQEKIFARDLVPGDIILLEVGDRVPADARVVESANLACDESMLTGESVPAQKKDGQMPEKTQLGDRKNMVFKDTVVTAGRARAVVVETGMGTEIGRVAGRMQDVPNPPTPLQEMLSGFMKLLGKLVVAGIIAVFALGIFVAGFSFEDTIRVAVAQAVSFIPEGLPVVVTITLAVGVGAMAAKNAIVRKLPAVETLGCVNVICTDKTGTLTKNEMTVRSIHSSGRAVDVSGEGYAISGGFSLAGKAVAPSSDADLLALLRTAALCNDAALEGEGESVRVLGDPTEGALLVAAAKAGIYKRDLEARYPRAGEIQFDSEKKYMATFNRAGGLAIQHVKGAPEKVLGFCTHALRNGKEVRITPSIRKEILSANERMASDALRILGFAFKPGAKISQSEPSGMVFAGLAGMLDPPREEVAASVVACREAGIRVVMVTGDHRMTAVGVARQLGLLEEGQLVMTGEELDALSDGEFSKKVEKIAIYARTTSEHKMRIVSAFQSKGHVVSMTGDGINDVLAIKKADVGIAMGTAGTEVTKESSDMILIDDNFATIVSAVEEGRGAYLNIKKVVSYLLATNSGEVVFLFIILLSGLFLPEALPLVLLPVQILWVNLVTDGCCVVPLSMEKRERDVMSHPPRKRSAPLITSDMAVFIVMSSLIMAAGTLFVFMVELPRGEIDHARTMAFATLVVFQLFSALNVRSRHSVLANSPFSNPYLIGGIALSFILQVGAIYAPFMNEAMHTTPLTLRDWIFVFAVCSTLLAAFELKKALERKGLIKAGQIA